MSVELSPQKDDLEVALQVLKNVLEGRFPETLPPNLEENEDLQSLLAAMQTLQNFALALGKGDLSQILPLKGPFAGGLKALQASLRHLTWQAQMIARGDFSQRVDFMGEFSEAINTMVASLQEAYAQRDEVERRLSEMNQDLQAEVEDRKRLEAEERQAREMAEKLLAAGEEINKRLDFEELLKTILIQVGRIIPYEAANIFIIEGDQAVMREHTGYDNFGEQAPQIVGDFSFKLSDFQLFLDIQQSQHPVVLSDTFEDPRWVRMEVDMSPVRSWCGLPLIVQDKVYGFLGLDHHEPGFYTDEHLEYLQIFAGQAALALENARLFAELNQMARRDPLTGISNRREFFERAQEELKRSCRYGSDVSILMIDIDHFKRVNDTYGHPVGDQVLQTIALQCQSNLRDVDLFGRYGGEEFVALLPHTGLEQAAITAERLRRLVAENPVQTDAGPVRCTISVGAAAFFRDCEILEVFLERADQALYHAKRIGRNRVSLARD